MRLLPFLLVVPLAGCFGGGQANPPELLDEPTADPPPLFGSAPDGARALAELRQFVDLAPRRYDNMFEHEDARQWLMKKVDASGLDVSTHAFTGPAQGPSGEAAGLNIIGIKPGRVNATLMVGAHYDSALTAYGGAYDDGTGTILAVELGRAIAGRSWNHTVAIGLWDQEEAGLVGSAAYAQDLSGDVVFYLNYDMTGINWPAQIGGAVDRPMDGYFGGAREAELVDLWRQAVADAGFPPEASTQQTGLGTGSSDHGSFRAADIDAGWIRGALIGSYPAYHNADTVESMEAIVGGDPADLEAGFDAVMEATLQFLILLDQVHAPATA